MSLLRAMAGVGGGVGRFAVEININPQILHKCNS